MGRGIAACAPRQTQRAPPTRTRGRWIQDNPVVPASGDTVRRRQACVLVVGNVEPEVQPWLRAGRHAISAVRDVGEASKALDETPADLVIVDRAGKLDAADVCRALRQDARLDEAWLLAITVQAQGRMADAVLDAGADDYLHRPFTRAELLARARASSSPRVNGRCR